MIEQPKLELLQTHSTIPIILVQLVEQVFKLITKAPQASAQKLLLSSLDHLAQARPHHQAGGFLSEHWLPGWGL